MAAFVGGAVGTLMCFSSRSRTQAVGIVRYPALLSFLIANTLEALSLQDIPIGAAGISTTG